MFWKLHIFTTYCVQICEGYNIDRTMEVDMDKRAYSDPEDPRNLFAAMYGGVYKREDPYDLRCGIYYYCLRSRPIYLNVVRPSVS